MGSTQTQRKFILLVGEMPLFQSHFDGFPQGIGHFEQGFHRKIDVSPGEKTGYGGFGKVIDKAKILYRGVFLQNIRLDLFFEFLKGVIFSRFHIMNLSPYNFRRFNILDDGFVRR